MNIVYFDTHIFAYTHTNKIFCGTHRNNRIDKQSRRVHDNNYGENGSAGSIECVGGRTYLRLEDTTEKLSSLIRACVGLSWC
jgi:23S rRNA maturation mini-RNase III